MPSCLLPTNNENGSSYQDHCRTSFGHLLGKLSIFFSFVRPSPGWRTASWIAHALRPSMARTHHIDKNSELRRVNRVRFSKCYNNGTNKINVRMKWFVSCSLDSLIDSLTLMCMLICFHGWQENPKCVSSCTLFLRRKTKDKNKMCQDGVHKKTTGNTVDRRPEHKNSTLMSVPSPPLRECFTINTPAWSE